MRQIHLSALAGLDLSDIWDYVATQSGNPEIANIVLDRIGERLMFLRRAPLAGRQRDDLGPGIRTFVLENYVIYYRAGEREVDILRVIHGKRDQTAVDLGERNQGYSNL